MAASGIMLAIGQEENLRLAGLNTSHDTLYLIFFVTTLSILWAVWNIFLEA